MANAAFQSRVASVKGGVECLTAVGFLKEVSWGGGVLRGRVVIEGGRVCSVIEYAFFVSLCNEIYLPPTSGAGGASSHRLE